MREIVISIDSHAIERIIYWVLILVLGGLLLWCYLGGGNCDGSENVTAAATTGTTTGAGEAADGGVVPLEEDTAPADTEPEETCFDGIKNQYETDVDCGGDCDAGCEEGDACFRDRDCDTDLTCESNECTAAPDLSGTIDFSLDDVTKLKSPTTETYKVDEIKVTVENGKSKQLTDPYLVVFVKSISGVFLNQAGAKEFEDKPYFTYTDMPSIDSGESKTITIDVNGGYIWDQVGYSKGDDFKVVVKIYDADDELIETTSKTVKI